MKTPPISRPATHQLKRFALASAVVVAGGWSLAPRAQAQAVFTWTNAASGNWSDSSKWTNDLGPGTAPVTGGQADYTLEFTPAGDYTATHDLGDGFLLNQLAFGGAVTLDGTSGLALSANGPTLPGINQDSGSGVTIGLPLELAADTTFGGTGGGQVKVTNQLSGTGSLTVDGSATLLVENSLAPNTYSGGTVINSGTLRLNFPTTVPLGTGPVTLNGGTLFLWRVNTNNPLFANGGRILSGNGFGNSWSGLVTLNTDLTVEPEYNITFHGIISGSGDLIIDHPNQNSVILTAANDYTGDTTVNSGTLVVNGNSIADANTLIIDGGKVQPTGTETVDTLYFDTGQQEAGTWGASGSGADNIDDIRFSGTAGVVNILTGIPRDEADILAFGLPGAPAVITGTGITWTVPVGTDLTDLAPTFELSFGAIATPASGTARDFTTPQTYAIDSGDGTITNKIYTVTVTPGPVPDTFTWTNAVAGNWSDALKWSDNLATGTGPGPFGGAFYALNFTAAGSYTTTHDLSDGFLLNQLSFAGAATLDGTSRLAFTADGPTLPRINQNSGSGVTISLPLELAADTTFGGTGGGQVKVSEQVTGTGSLTIDASGTLLIENILTSNTYGGGTIINNGTLRLNFPTSDPIGTGPVTLNNGTLFLWRVSPTNALIVNGGRVVSSNGFGNKWLGPVTLNTDLLVEPQFKIIFSGTITGTGGLIIDNQSNTVALAAANGYTGDTVVNRGTLEVNGDSINDAGKLIIGGGSVKPAGTEIVKALFFGAVKQAAGTWGATGSGADHIDDARFTGTDGVIEVPPDRPYDIWLAKYPGLAGDDALPPTDPDRDGLTNEQEFTFGLDPTNGLSLDPFAVPLDAAAGTLGYTRRDPSLTGLTYRVWTSPDLVSWTEDTGAVQTSGAVVDDVQAVAVQLSAGLLSAPTLFVQLRAGALYAADFEAGDDGFTSVNKGGGNDWAHGDPESADLGGGEVTEGNGGSAQCWGTNLTGPYAANTDACLRSPVIDLTGVAGATLTFARALDANTGHTLEVNVIDDTTDAVIANVIPAAEDGDINTAPWETIDAVPIPVAAMGQPVRLEWRFTGNGDGNFLGAYIDDVVVREATP